MTSRSKQLTLDEVTAGMVLSDDLLDSHGNVLLPQGVTLSDATIASLRRHDVETLPILCEALSDAESAAELARHKQRLAVLFRKHDEDDEASTLLLEYLTHYRMDA